MRGVEEEGRVGERGERFEGYGIVWSEGEVREVLGGGGEGLEGITHDGRGGAIFSFPQSRITMIIFLYTNDVK